jgi:hypothetical protein
VDDDASTEEIEAPDSGEEVAPRVTRSAKKATPAKSPAKGETPGKRERGKTPKGKLIGGLRMPLAKPGAEEVDFERFGFRRRRRVSRRGGGGQGEGGRAEKTPAAEPTDGGRRREDAPVVALRGGERLRDAQTA